MIVYIKIKDNIELKDLEKYGFNRDTHSPNCFIKGEYDYCYNFLRIDMYTKELFISSGVDEVNGDSELIKLVELINDGIVEVVEEKEINQ